MLSAPLLISVIIPTFNRINSLSLLLKKLSQQTIFSQIEIIVVDQNNKGYLQKNISPELLSISRIVQQAKPNVSTARNLGATKSKGEILFFVDDDLEPEPDFLERSYKSIITNNIDCLIPLVYNSLGQAHEIEGKKRLTLKHISENLKLISESISAAIFFKKTSFFKTGGFDPILFDYVKSTEDQEFFIRIRNRGIQIHFDQSLDIFHSEEVEGGCDLRTRDYLTNRKKFIKGWCFRYRAHNGGNLSLSIGDLIKVTRSAFLNSDIIKRSIDHSYALFKFSIGGIIDSKKAIHPFKSHYTGVQKVNHFDLIKNYV